MATTYETKLFVNAITNDTQNVLEKVANIERFRILLDDVLPAFHRVQDLLHSAHAEIEELKEKQGQRYQRLRRFICEGHSLLVTIEDEVRRVLRTASGPWHDTLFTEYFITLGKPRLIFASYACSYRTLEEAYERYLHHTSIPTFGRMQTLFNVGISFEGIESILASVKSALAAFALDVTDRIVGIVANLFVMFQNMDSKSSVVCCLTSIGAHLGLVGAFVSTALGFINKMKASRATTNETQALGPGSSWWETIICYTGALLFLIVGALVIYAIPGKHTFDEFLSRARNLPHVLTSLGGLAEYGSKVFSFVSDFVAEKYLGVPRNISGYEEVNAWMLEVAKVCTGEFVDTLKVDNANVMLVEELYAQGLKHARTFDVLKSPQREQSSFRTHLTALNGVLARARESGAGKVHLRKEPLLIQFFGSTGVGKSVLTALLNADFAMERGAKSREDVAKMVYSRKVGQEFWDGYSSQVIINYDDFGAVKDSEANPNTEFLEMIHTQNNSPYPLHMASLVEKCNTYFQGEVVILTSNMRTYNMPSLTNPEAVTRRIDRLIKVRVHADFAKEVSIGGKIVTNLDHTLIKDAPMESVWQFDIYDSNAALPTLLQGDLTYPQLRDMLLNMDQEKRGRNETLLNNIDKYMSLRGEQQIDEDEYFEARSDRHWSQSPIEGLGPRVTENDTVVSPEIVGQRVFSGYVTDYSQKNVSVPPRITFEKYVETTTAMNTIVASQHQDGSHSWWGRALFTPHSAGSYAADHHYDAANFNDVWFPTGSVTVDVSPVVAECAQVVLGDIPYFQCAMVPACARALFAAADQSARRTIMARIVCDSDWRRQFEKRYPALLVRYLTMYNTTLVPAGHCFFSNDALCHLLSSIVPCATGCGGVVSAFLRRAKLYHQEMWSGMQANCATSLGLDNATYGRAKTICNVVSITVSLMSMYCFYSFSRDIFNMVRKWYNPIMDGDMSLEAFAQEEDAKMNGVAEQSGDNRTRSAVKRNVLEQSGDNRTKSAPKRAVIETKMSEARTNLERVVKNNLLAEEMLAETIVGQTQVAIDQNAAVLVAQLITRNQYKLEILYKDGWKHAVTVTFLEGRRAITVAHVIPPLMQSERFRLVNARYPQGIEFLCHEIIGHVSMIPYENPLYGKRDFCVIDFPKRIIQHPSILCHFGDAEDFKQYREVRKGALVGYCPTAKATLARVYVTDAIRASESVIELEGKDYTERLFRFFAYNVETIGGDCGMLLVSLCKEHTRKIIGIHCGGTPIPGYTGISTPLSIGAVRAAISFMAKPDVQIALPEVGEMRIPATLVAGEETLNNMYEGGEFKRSFLELQEQQPLAGIMALGSVVRPVFQPGKTDIFHSPIGCELTGGEYLTAPARLRPFRNEEHQLINPMALARNKIIITPSLISDDMIRDASFDFFSKLDWIETTRKPRVLQYVEAIKGVEKDEWVQPLDRKSSPGYPWILEKDGMPGKTRWLGSGEDWCLDDAVLMKAVNDRVENAERGIRTSTIWVDTLKDERRELAKVALGKTRLFSVGPIDFNLAFRMYFGDFAAKIMESRVIGEACVGINPYSLEWTVLATMLLQKGENLLAGDFSNFDGTLQSSILWEILRKINEMYAAAGGNPKDDLVREVLWAEIVHSVHLVGSDLYVWNQSQPSGNPLTVIINSVYNSIACRLAYIITAQVHSPENAYMDSFTRNVDVFNYGDDNLWSISEEITSWFNMSNITEAFAAFGMVYTTETKEIGATSFRKISEIGFLKRRFVFDKEQNRWLAPLALATVLEMAQWVRGKTEHHALCAQNLETAAYELALHGRIVFNEHFPKIMSAAKKLTTRPNLLRYEAYMQREYVRYVDSNALFFDGFILGDEESAAGSIKTGKITMAFTTNEQTTTNDQESHEFCGAGISSDLQSVELLSQNNSKCEKEGVRTGGTKKTAAESMQVASYDICDSLDNRAMTRPWMCLLCDKKPCFLTLDELMQHGVKHPSVVERVDRGFRVRCWCRTSFKTVWAYQQHFVREHVKDLRPRVILSAEQTVCEIMRGVMQMENSNYSAGAGGGSEDNTQAAVGGTQTTVVDEVVTFQDLGDVAVATNTASKTSNLPGNQGVEARDHTIKNFLTRPYRKPTFTWPLTAAPLTPLASFDLPQSLFEVPAFTEKLNGFTFFRPLKMCVKLQVNTQPFQQGILMMVAVPYRKMIANPFSNISHLPGLTGYPHVLINIAENQSAELCLPYVAPMNTLHVTRETFSLYTVLVVVYGQLRAGDDVNVTPWVQIQEIENEIPTGLKPYVPATVLYGKMAMGAVSDVHDQMVRGAQAGRANRLLTSEAVSAKDGTVTKIASAGAAISLAASAVPVLTPIAAPVAALLGAVAGLGHLFGWSKPTLENEPTPQQPTLPRYAATYDGADASKMLALEAKNGIGREPIFGSSVDEMALRYVTGRPCFYRSFAWNIGDAPGTILFSEAVAPLSTRAIQTFSPTYPNVYSLPLVAYTANAFKLWRGKMIYRLIFVKTKSYHSGRILITLIPFGADRNGMAITGNDEALCYREVVDLAELSEKVIEVPYMNDRAWTDVGPLRGPRPYTALLTIEVLNELRRPNTITSDVIDIIVEKCGGDDFELACPSAQIGRPISVMNGPPTTLKGKLAMGWSTEGIQMQSEPVEPLFRSNTGELDAINENTIGEKVVSIRQLLNRNEQFTIDVLGAGGSASAATYVSVYNNESAIASNVIPTNARTSMYNWFSPIYAYMRGGMRIKAFNDGVLDSRIGGMMRASLFYADTEGLDAVGATAIQVASTGYLAEPSTRCPFDVRYDTFLERVVEAQVPYYNQYAMVPTPPMGLWNPITTTAFIPKGSAFYLENMTTTPVTMAMYRSVADDFSMGFLVGAPLVYFFTLT